MFSGDAKFRSQLDAKAYDFQTVEIKSLVKAGEEQQLFYETVSHLSRNRKQDSLKVIAAKVDLPSYN